MRVRVDTSICSGHALCAAQAPEVYEVDDAGYCMSDGKTVPPDLIEKAKLGVSYCPERAIKLVDENE